MAELVGFVGSSHKDRSLNFDAQRCINLFPQVSASGTSKSPAKLVSAPGLSVFCDFSATISRGVRGMIQFDDNSLFVVAGTKVLRVDAAGAVTAIGTVPSEDTPVSMATNGITIFFVTGPKGFVITPATNTVVEYVDASFAGADAVWFLAGSYVFNKTGTSQFQAMAPYSTTLDPLWFATAEGSPDALVTLAVDNQEVWLFGTETLEVWTNDGGAGFPYSRVPGVFIEQGCIAKNSVVKLEGLFWLSSNDHGQGMVFHTVGLSAKRISDFSLEQEIATYPTITDAVGYGYQQEGHSFYVLTFPTQNITWVYDLATATWTQRAWLDVDGSFSRHRSNCHAFFGRKNLVGDWDLGKIYQMSTLIYSDAGNPLVRLRASPHVGSNGARIAHANIEFDIETGVGLQDGQGSDPQIQLRWSDDNGHTFKHARMKSVGAVGKYKKRVRFTRLGQARDRVYELSYSEPTSFTIMGARINAAQ